MSETTMGKLVAQGPDTGYLAWVERNFKLGDLCVCGHKVDDHKHAGSVPCLECSCSEIRKEISLFNRLKTCAYHSVEEEAEGKECGCEDHDNEDPLECSCCDPCMLYHANLTQRNFITSTATVAELRALFEDDPAEWVGILEMFVDGLCPTKT